MSDAVDPEDWPRPRRHLQGVIQLIASRASGRRAECRTGDSRVGGAGRSASSETLPMSNGPTG
jgi:hypothetical protein